MPRRPSRSPKHRAESLPRQLGRKVRNGVILTVTAAGLVTAGVLGADHGRVDDPAAAVLAAVDGASDASAGLIAPSDLARLAESRSHNQVSRSDRRTPVVGAKRALLDAEAKSGGQITRTKQISSGDPRTIAQAMLGEYGWSSDQFGCLDSLWTKESGWNASAANPTSSAYGIPQALPGSKMASAGSDWATNPATQIRWGLGYIADSYGSPCSAWSHSMSSGWY